jgi:hypothetical protein
VATLIKSASAVTILHMHLAKRLFTATISDNELTKLGTKSMTKRQYTDRVKATPRGILKIQERINERILSEKEKLRREESTLTFNREDIAKEAGVSLDALKRFCSGKRVMRENAIKITNYLGLNLDDIIEIESSIQKHPSGFYVKRPSLDDRVFSTIHSPGTLIRLKAPSKMGKTSLAIELLSQLQDEPYRTVYVTFLDADSDSFTDLEKFLKWFCIQVADALMPNDSPETPDEHLVSITQHLENKWRNDIDKKGNCIDYFEKYLLTTIETPIILVLDDVDLVFNQSNVGFNFCQMLRSWNTKAKTNEVWKKMNLIVIHSTDIYGELDINSSPLQSVGEVFQPKGFNTRQAQELAQAYSLNLRSEEIERLRNFIDGNPYLLHEAIDFFSKNEEMTLDRYLQIAPIPMGPYHNYLSDLWSTLNHNSRLITIFQQILNSTTGIQVDQDAIFQLDRMGLIKLEERSVHPVISCELYKLYFQDRLQTKNNSCRV